MRSAILLIVALLTGLPVTVSAQGVTLERIRAKGVITMGYIQDGVPFSFLGPDKQPQDADTLERVRALLDAAP